MTDLKEIKLDPFVLNYLKDGKPSKLILDFIVEQFLNISHELCSTDSVYGAQSFRELTQLNPVKIVEWKSEDSSVVVKPMTMKELVSQTSMTGAEKICSHLISIPPRRLEEIMIKLKEYLYTVITAKGSSNE